MGARSIGAIASPGPAGRPGRAGGPSGRRRAATHARDAPLVAWRRHSVHSGRKRRRPSSGVVMRDRAGDRARAREPREGERGTVKPSPAEAEAEIGDPVVHRPDRLRARLPYLQLRRLARLRRQLRANARTTAYCPCVNPVVARSKTALKIIELRPTAAPGPPRARTLAAGHPVAMDHARSSLSPGSTRPRGVFDLAAKAGSADGARRARRAAGLLGRPARGAEGAARSRRPARGARPPGAALESRAPRPRRAGRAGRRPRTIPSWRPASTRSTRPSQRDYERAAHEPAVLAASTTSRDAIITHQRRRRRHRGDRLGRRCCCACTCAGPSGTASRPRSSTSSKGEEAGIKSATIAVDGSARLRLPARRARRPPARAHQPVRLPEAAPHDVRARRGAARGRGRRRGRRDPRRRAAHRDLPLPGRRRPARQQDRLRRPPHPHPDGHRGPEPERALAAPEPRARP